VTVEPPTAVKGMHPRGTDILLAISLANLNLLQVWRELIFASPADLYFMPSPTSYDYAAALLVLVGLAALIFILVRLIRRLPERAANLFFLALCVAALINPLDYLRRAMLLHTSFSDLLLIATSPAIILAATMWWYSRAVSRIAYTIGVILSVFALTNAVQAAWRLAVPAQILPAHAASIARINAPAANRPAGRVLWLIFDDLDERFLFSRRAVDYHYPAFDKFRDQSVHFTRVRPPGGGTIRAMPALWLGQPVAEARQRDSSELAVRLEGEDVFRRLRDLPHIFGAAKARGASIAAIGWYHPYCRLFPDLLDFCEAPSFLTTRLSQSGDLAEAAKRVLNALHPLWRRVLHVEIYERTLAASLMVAADPRFDFVAIHVPLPHGPFIFDARAGKLTWHGLSSTYEDNVALADRYLETLRNEMTQAGLWDETAIVISADHGSRKRQGDVRAAVGALPLLVKLPAQQRGEVVERVVDAEIQHGLVSAMLEGKMRSPQSLADWLADKGL
jgi:Type I phosphodiesterase / nucleotide pyrophosphatase